jgi:hypothetical protein
MDTAADSEGFYAGLPPVTDFAAITRAGSYRELPRDWHVAFCDVRDSTGAVAAGKYRNVNSVGAAAITAVINAVDGVDIPFSFEGDGAVLCVPPRRLDAVRAALAKAREVALAAFGLDLRIATVPVSDIPAGFSVRVARYRVSENYHQAAFSGGGIACIDALVKDPATAGRYLIEHGSIEPQGSFEGFECRWQDVPSRHGETVSLMVLALHHEPERAAAVYCEVIAKVLEIYGDEEDCHPLALPQLAMTMDGDLLEDEAGIRTAAGGYWRRWRWKMHTRLMVLAGAVLMRFGIRTAATDWRRYKPDLVRNADVRKFSDIYRQILSGTTAQRHALEAWLQKKFGQRQLLYGLHVTDRAHMTCLVFDYAGRHLHFIDGADGGLFLAAKAFKDRANQYVSRTGL